METVNGEPITSGVTFIRDHRTRGGGGKRRLFINSKRNIREGISSFYWFRAYSSAKMLKRNLEQSVCLGGVWKLQSSDVSYAASQVYFVKSCTIQSVLSILLLTAEVA